MNIVIPMAGKGSRFLTEGFTESKPFIKIMDKPIIFWLIDCLSIQPEDSVHFVCNNSMNLKEFKRELEKYEFSFFVHAIKATGGPADTVHHIVKNIRNDQRLVVLDSDTWYEEDILKYCRDSEHGNLIFYFKDSNNKALYSYIKIQDKKVIDIKEKKKISDNANIGCYCFESTSTYEKFYTQTEEECFVSHVYLNMIKKTNVYAREVKSFHCVGTPTQLKTFCTMHRPNGLLRMCSEINKVEEKKDTVVKNGNLKGEKYWYENIPNNLSHLFPKPIKLSESEIILEKIEGITFSHLYVEKLLAKREFYMLITEMDKIHSIRTKDNVNIKLNYAPKLKERYANFDYSPYYGSERTYLSLLKFFEKYEPKYSTIHGDPVFTNVILTEEQIIKLIDMRGSQGDALTQSGDILYDYAKVYQSIIGYDFIFHDMEYDYIYINRFRKIFENYFESKFGHQELKNLKQITSSLLFSLIPLHKDDTKRKRYYELILTL